MPPGRCVKTRQCFGAYLHVINVNNSLLAGTSSPAGAITVSEARLAISFARRDMKIPLVEFALKGNDVVTRQTFISDDADNRVLFGPLA